MIYRIRIPHYVFFGDPGSRTICAPKARIGELIDWLRETADKLEDEAGPDQ